MLLTVVPPLEVKLPPRTVRGGWKGLVLSEPMA